MSLLIIETQTKKYSDAYSELTDSISKMEQEVEKARNKFLPQIKAGVSKLKATGEKLHEAIDENKYLFVKPKTQIFHNIRVGFIKGKGKKEFNNDTTVALIHKHFPDKAELLIQIEEKIISKAIEQLSAADLKKIGVNIVDAQDEIVIKPVDSEIKKVIDKIISEITSKEDEVPIIVLGERKTA